MLENYWHQIWLLSIRFFLPFVVIFLTSQELHWSSSSSSSSCAAQVVLQRETPDLCKGWYKIRWIRVKETADKNFYSSASSMILSVMLKKLLSEKDRQQNETQKHNGRQWFRDIVFSYLSLYSLLYELRFRITFRVACSQHSSDPFERCIDRHWIDTKRDLLKILSYLLYRKGKETRNLSLLFNREDFSFLRQPWHGSKWRK